MDIRDKAAVNADYALTIADVRVWEQHGLVPGSVVLLYTGCKTSGSIDMRFQPRC